MKAIQSMIALAAIAIGMSVPVSAATTDPEVIIYRFPGVRDDGNAITPGSRRSSAARTSVVYRRPSGL